MDGVTTAVVLFIFLAIARPGLIKHRTQYYAAIGAVLLLLALRCLATIVAGNDAAHGFARFVTAMSYLLDMAAVLLLVMSAGGLSARDLAGEMGDALDEVRRGDTRPTIVPLTGEMPAERKPRPDRDRPTGREDTDFATRADAARARGPAKPADNSSIPLDEE